MGYLLRDPYQSNLKAPTNLLVLRIHLGFAGLELSLDLDQLRVVLLHALADPTNPFPEDHGRLGAGRRWWRRSREVFVVILIKFWSKTLDLKGLSRFYLVLFSLS